MTFTYSLGKIPSGLSFVVLAVYSVATAGFAQSTGIGKQILPLVGSWEFAQHSDGPEKWLPAQVPGDVHLDLLRNKLIPDPYYRDNEAKLQWIEDASWSYRTTFHVDPAMMRRSHVELVFDGLDTTAHIFLNGKKVLDANNMFRGWRVDAKHFLLLGNNDLRVDFDPAGKVAKALANADPTHSETQIPDKAYLRKAAYEYGWDWGPKFVTYGIWRPVSLESWDEARISDVQISQPDVSAEAARLAVHVTVEAGAETAAEIALSYGITESHTEASEKVHLHSGTNLIVLPININHPSLWFPAGYGPQTLYNFVIRVDAHGQLQDAKSVKTGLRSIKLVRERDQWGRSFGLVVNGIPIFAKGADVIPFDSFPNRVGLEQYRRILESAKEANMNMIRLWGGGYYESEEFYNLCDELGLMVWQDFMFASSWYPGDYNWKQNVKLEATYQVDRLRNHPSITLWSGNNEVESVLYAFLGKQSAEGKLQIWKDYLTTFSGILPSVVEREDPEVPYWPSSPSADYETTSDAFQSGDSHDWSIWHGREPFKNYENHFARFNSEYGFQSFPELRTVESFTTPADRANIFTPVMLAHQKNNEGNSIIHEYLLRDYAEPKDFPSFLYVSQVLQAEGVKVGAEHMRRSRPRIMGSLFWQLNDCWPVASWSSIDYFGRWKALQYYARRFYSPFLISPTVQDGNVDIFAVSDSQEPTPASLRIRVMTMGGKLVKQEQKEIVMPALSSQRFSQWSLQSILQEDQNLSDIFLIADLSVEGKEVSRNILYLQPTKLVHLAPASIHTALTKEGTNYKLRLASPVLARDVYVTFADQDATLSDNYFDLLPGEPLTLTITSKAGLPILEKTLKVVSLTDAFDGTATTTAETPGR